MVAGGGFAIFLLPAETVQGALILVDHDDSTTPMRLDLVTKLQLGSLFAAAAAAGLGWFACRERGTVLAFFGFALEDAHALGRKIWNGAVRLARPGERWKLVALGGVMLAGGALRVAALDAPMRYDESYTFQYHASRDVLNLVSDYTTPNNHIFHSLLVHCSYLLWGDSPAALRLPALLAGWLLIPGVFWLGRRLLDDETALIAAGFVAVSHPLIAYSANARGYTLVALFAVVGFLAATRLSEAPSLSGWGLLAGASILGFFTLPVMLYGYAVISFWLIASATRERRKPLLYELAVASAVVAVAAAVLYLPSAVRCGISNIISNQFVRPLALLDFLGGLPVLAGELVGYRPGGLPPAAGMAMAAAAGASFFGSGALGRRSRLVLGAVLLTIPPIIALQRVLPYARVFLVVLPICLVLVAAGLRRVIAAVLPRGRWRDGRVALAVALLLAGLLGAAEWKRPKPAGLFTDLAAVMETLKPMLSGGDHIVAGIPLSEPLRYHARRAGLHGQVVHEFRDFWGPRQLDKYDTIYFVEEKNTRVRVFTTWTIEAVPISHPVLREKFDPPVRIGETRWTRLYRLRRASR